MCHAPWALGHARSRRARWSLSFARSARAHEAPTPWPVSFTDIARQAGLTTSSVYGGETKKRFIIETNGAGVALLDLDGDGWLDAIVLNGTRLKDGTRENESWPDDRRPTAHVYRNKHDGTFDDVTRGSGLDRVAWSSSICAGDIDNDGRLDLVRHRVRHQRALSQPWRVPFRRCVGGARTARVGNPVGLGMHVHRLRQGRPPRSVRLELPSLRSAYGVRAWTRRELLVERHPRQLRPQRPADRHESPLPPGAGRYVP